MFCAFLFLGDGTSTNATTPVSVGDTGATFELPSLDGPLQGQSGTTAVGITTSISGLNLRDEGDVVESNDTNTSVVTVPTASAQDAAAGSSKCPPATGSGSKSNNLGTAAQDSATQVCLVVLYSLSFRGYALYFLCCGMLY